VDSKDERIIDIELRAGNDHYETIDFIYDLGLALVNKGDKRVTLGQENKKVCRFCKKNLTQTTFKKKAHVIPEFMGNKYFFSHFECDQCNDLFSLYETSLANYGGILNTFSKIKGKKGYAKHKSSIESTETFIEDDKVVIRIHKPTGTDKNSLESVQYDEATQMLTLNTTKYPYVPIDAYKALLKIALCMISDNELSDYETPLKWLVNNGDYKIEEQKPLFHVYKRVGGLLFKHPFAILFKKKSQMENEPCPSHTLILHYGIFKYQIFLPGNIQDKWMWDRERIVLPILSGLVNPNNKEQPIDFEDFSSNQKITKPIHSFRLPFKNEKK
jgi:hypothetical protein